MVRKSNSRAQDAGAGSRSPDVAVGTVTSLAAPPVRNDLLSKAVSFLLNPRVRGNSEDQKRVFLIWKGLTPHEIDLAIDFANRGVPFPSRMVDGGSGEVYPLDQFHQQQHLPAPAAHLYRHEIQYQYPGTFAMTRALVPSFIVVSGLFYGLYLLYRRFQHLLFGDQQQKHALVQVQESLQQLTVICESLNKSIHEMEDNIVAKMRKEMESLTRPSAQEVAAVSEIKKELASVKALLLGRKQFPESPSLTQASIPAWQMTDESKERQ